MDQLNGTLSLDNWTTEELRRLSPHMGVFDLNAPRQVSKNLSMPKPVVATISNWVHRTIPPDPIKLVRMNELFPDYTGPTPQPPVPEAITLRAEVEAVPDRRGSEPNVVLPRRRKVDHVARATDKS